MHGYIIRENCPAVPNYSWVNPIIVNVAVEYFAPATAAGKTDAIAVAVKVRQAYHNDYVVPFTWHPTVERQHTISIMRVHDAKTLVSQRRKLPAQLNQFSSKTQEIAHCRIGCA